MTLRIEITATAKRRLRRLLALGSLALASCLTPACAWNSTGHMTVAGIAYDNLTPKTKARVDALLQKQRDYPLWMRELPTGYTNRARFAFMKAATWPDDIRRTPDDRPIWHYIDVPVIAPGYTPDPLALLPVKPNAETQIPVEAALLTDKTASDGDRAVALCWVEHLVGDIHQPLHDSSFFSATFPKGDRGGNSETLPASAVSGDPLESAANPHNLHAFWDDLLGNTQDPVQIDKIAAGLETTVYARRTFPQIAKDKTVHTWVMEGNTLARDVVYGSGLTMTPNGGNTDVTLPASYLETAHRTANRQIALAGLRLADMLNALSFPPTSATAPGVPASTSAPQLGPGSPVTSAAPHDPGAIVGNLRTHIYHLPGTTGLPAEKNSVYFSSEEAAKAAGYRPAGPAVSP